MDQGKDLTGTPAGSGKSEEKIERLKARIMHTHSDIKDTVESLTEKLSPGHIKKEVSGKVQEAALGRIEDMAERIEIRAKEAGLKIVDTIKRNPIPAALAGIGLFLLIKNRAKTGPRYPEEYKEYEGEEYAESEKASEQVQTVRKRLEETSRETIRKAGQVKGQAMERAQELGYSTREKAEDVFDNTRRLVQRNIWGAGLVALVLGMLLGLAIPESEKERQVMGGASRKAFSRARRKAGETVEKAQSFAEEALKTAAEKAQEEEFVK